MANHTPFPWDIKAATDLCIIGPKPEDGKEDDTATWVATVHANKHPENRQTTAGGWVVPPAEEAAANAQLLKGIPGILEALRRARQGYANMLEFHLLRSPSMDKPIQQILFEIDKACIEAGVKPE